MTEEKSTINLEAEKAEYEFKLKRVHHLLNVMEHQYEEIEKVYLMSKGKKIGDNYSDYLTTHLDEFKSLLEIASDITKTDDSITLN